MADTGYLLFYDNPLVLRHRHGGIEGDFQGGCAVNVYGDPLAPLSVHRLYHHGPADSCGGLGGAGEITGTGMAWTGEAGGPQELRGSHFVRGRPHTDGVVIFAGAAVSEHGRLTPSQW